jgi:nucleoside-diphosphate-sugar epimerase
MKVLITGGGGYCGIPLCESLLAYGHEVTVVDNFRLGPEPLLHLVANRRLTIVARDIRQDDRSYLRGQDIVFHLAAVSGQVACDVEPATTRAVNVDATARLVRMLDAGQLLVYPSTTAFYGAAGLLYDEDTLPMPVSLYGKTKFEAERIVIDRSNSVVLRLATIFGLSPRMRTELLVNDFVASATSRGKIVLYGAEAGRTFMHIDDLVRSYQFVIDHSDGMTGRVFNVGTARLNLTKRQVAERVRVLCPCIVAESDVPSSDKRDFAVAFGKIGALGFDCLHSLDEGIEQLSKWYQVLAGSGDNCHP